MTLRQALRTFAAVSVISMLCATFAVAQNQAPSNGAIFRWNGTSWVQVDGGAVRIAVGANGPWVVNAAGDIYRWGRTAFEKLPGGAKDIGVGEEGTAWILGLDDRVYRWNGRDWAQMPGSGIAISVERYGMPWLVDQQGNILHWRNNRFVTIPGAARDIGAGTGVWVVGTDNAVHRLDDNGFASVGGGSAIRVSAGAPGTAWMINDAGEIYRFENGRFRNVPGWASDIGVNASGEAWIIGDPARMPRGGTRRGRPRP